MLQNCNFSAPYNWLILLEKTVLCLNFLQSGQRSGSTTEHYQSELVCCMLVLDVGRDFHYPYIPLFVLCIWEFLSLWCISYLPAPALDKFLQLQLCSLLQLSVWNTSFMHQQLEKMSVIWCCINCWAIVLQCAGVLIAGSEMLVIQQALERYWNVIVLQALVLKFSEQVKTNHLGKFHFRFVMMLAMEKHSISITTQAPLLINWMLQNVVYFQRDYFAYCYSLNWI